MAHVPLRPLGAPADSDLDAATLARHAEALSDRERDLCERRAAVAAGWGEKYRERVHAKGKLTSRERLARLADEHTAAREQVRALEAEMDEKIAAATGGAKQLEAALRAEIRSLDEATEGRQQQAAALAEAFSRDITRFAELEEIVALRRQMSVSPTSP